MIITPTSCGCQIESKYPTKYAYIYIYINIDTNETVIGTLINDLRDFVIRRI